MIWKKGGAEFGLNSWGHTCDGNGEKLNLIYLRHWRLKGRGPGGGALRKRIGQRKTPHGRRTDAQVTFIYKNEKMGNVREREKGMI